MKHLIDQIHLVDTVEAQFTKAKQEADALETQLEDAGDAEDDMAEAFMKQFQGLVNLYASSTNQKVRMVAANRDKLINLLDPELLPMLIKLNTSTATQEILVGHIHRLSVAKSEVDAEQAARVAKTEQRKTAKKGTKT